MKIGTRIRSQDLSASHLGTVIRPSIFDGMVVVRWDEVLPNGEKESDELPTDLTIEQEG